MPQRYRRFWNLSGYVDSDKGKINGTYKSDLIYVDIGYEVCVIRIDPWNNSIRYAKRSVGE